MKQLFLFLLGITVFSESLTQSFPEQWLGKWQGEVSIYSLKQEVLQRVKMSMDIQTLTDTTWQWQTIYYAEDSIVSEKNYRLVTIDAAAGLYQVDELNGIQLQAQMLGNRLITFFEVGNNLLTITYFMHQNQLHFEVYFADNKSKVKTGGTSDDVPIVLTYRASTFQQAVLSKLEK